MQDEVSEVSLKVTMVGYLFVGKTMLKNRLIGESFKTSYKATVGADINKWEIPAGQTVSALTLWEISSRENNSGVLRLYLKDTDLLVCVWSASDPRSFEHIANWLTELKGLGFNFNIPVLFVRNKSDMVDSKKISVEEQAKIKQWAEKYGIKSYDTVNASAKCDIEPFKAKLLECVKSNAEQAIKRDVLVPLKAF